MFLSYGADNNHESELSRIISTIIKLKKKKKSFCYLQISNTFYLYTFYYTFD